MTRTQKRNLFLGTLLLLGVGGYFLHKKKKKTTKKLPEVITEPEGMEGFEEVPYSIDAECERQIIPFTPENRDYAEAVVNGAMNALGGYMSLPEKLGSIPGDMTTNLEFLRALASQIFLQTVHPNCIPEETPENSFGVDLTLVTMPSEETQKYIREIFASLTYQYDQLGFDLGGTIVQAPDIEETILGFGLDEPLVVIGEKDTTLHG